MTFVRLKDPVMVFIVIVTYAAPSAINLIVQYSAYGKRVNLHLTILNNLG